MSRMGMMRAGWRFLTRRPAPISVGCLLTHRCDLHCQYCDLPLHVGEELSTEQWKQAISELAAAGTIRFGFAGGEPLLREDVGEIVRHASRTGATTTLNTNATLLAERIGELDALDILTTSLDGASAEAHTLHRGGRNGWERTIEAIERARRRGLTVYTLTVVTRHNLGEIPAILDLADELGFWAGFQPVSRCEVSAPAEAIGSLAPEPAAFHDAVRFLMDARRSGRNVLSSMPTLRNLLHYPERRSGHCRSAGRYFCYIDPSGSVFPCHFVYNPEPGAHPSGRTLGFARAFEQCTQDVAPCPGCYIVPLNEMNLLFSLSPGVLWNQLGRLLGGA